MAGGTIFEIFVLSVVLRCVRQTGSSKPCLSKIYCINTAGTWCFECRQCYNIFVHHELIYYPSDVLFHKAQPVQKFDSVFSALLQDMIAAMQKKKGVGIAAPQVGARHRCFHVRHENKIITFVNPVIAKSSIETNLHEEGCLSIPGVYAEVERHTAVTVRAQDEKGNPFLLDAKGFFARVIQHEFDHLEGVLFIDRISKPAQRLVLKAYKPPQAARERRIS